MPLSDDLRDVPLTFHCPHCGYALIRKGRWFKSVSRVKCGGCRREIRMTYDNKIKVFAKHALLTEGLAE
jgi:hypothetical protein